MIGSEPASQRLNQVLSNPVAGDERRCRMCGCTESRRCVNVISKTCAWVLDSEGGDLCSNCAVLLYGTDHDGELDAIARGEER